MSMFLFGMARDKRDRCFNQTRPSLFLSIVRKGSNDFNDNFHIFPFQIEPQECHRQRASASVRGHGRLCGAAREEAKRATTTRVKEESVVWRCDCSSVLP